MGGDVNTTARTTGATGKPVLPTAAATAVGSMPHIDPDVAAALSLDLLPNLPAAPQLPRRDVREGMLAQSVDGMSGVAVAGDGSLRVDRAGFDPEQPIDTSFDGEGWRGLRVFLAAARTRRGPVKLQLTGPLTLGIALAEAGVETDAAFAAAANAVTTRARALVSYASDALPGSGLVVVLDEPGLGAWGSDRLPLKGDDVVDLLSSGLASLGPRVVTGVHCCGEIDWKLATAAGPDLVSLPVTPGLVDAAPTLAAFLERGGLIAWGVVPTDRPIGTDPDPLWRRLADLWCDMTRAGCDPIRLRQQALVTPACGLANHDPIQAAQILDLTMGVAERVHSQAVAIRMSVGA
ncbi:MAG: hypothetical protein KY443_03540 [Actinobacteria bacterium]|nr:hypothetical protein [Actinomycetota bacterium]